MLPFPPDISFLSVAFVTSALVAPSDGFNIWRQVWQHFIVYPFSIYMLFHVVLISSTTINYCDFNGALAPARA